MTFVPCLVRSMEGSELVSITLGDPLVDGYLEFVGARGAVNTWLATAYDLKVFFEVVAKDPAEVTAADAFGFLAVQRAPRRGERVVRIEDGEPGLAARTIAQAALERGWLVRVSARARRCRGVVQSGAAWVGGSSRWAPWPGWGAVGAHSQHPPAPFLNPIETPILQRLFQAEQGSPGRAPPNDSRGR